MDAMLDNGTVQASAPDQMQSNALVLYQLLASNLSIVILITIAAIAISTRLGSASETSERVQGIMEVPRVPYWLPIIGHIPNMAWNAESFMRRLRSSYINGAYSLNFGGTVHNIIYTPGLVTSLLNAKDSNASHKSVADWIGETVFGFPMAKEAERYHAAEPEIRECYSYLLNEADLSTMVRTTAHATQQSITSFVSFCRSIVDQAYWERTANAQVTIDKTGDEVVEASLVDLVRDYCAIASNSSIIGTDFIKNFPDFLANLWILDRGFLLLGSGLPRWIPIPLLTRAHIARRNLLKMVSEYERAMDKHTAGEDPGPDWRDLDDVGAVFKARTHVYRKHKFSYVARASYDLGMLWATNANSNMLVFWMLNRIYADKELLVTIRNEIDSYAKAVQPKQEFAIPEPIRLETFDVDGLCTKCPLLKSCYIECLRVDAATWSFKVAKQDFTLSSRDKGSAESFMMRKGDYIHAAHDLHNSDPKYFSKPDTWLADRHVRTDDDGKRNADMGTIRPYGGGSSMCKGRFFAYKECMMFVAAIVAMWDIQPRGGGQWKTPSHRKSTGVYGTSSDTRVWIKRRRL